MKKFLLTALKLVVLALVVVVAWMMGGYYALKPTMDTLHQCEQMLPGNEKCVVVVVPKFILQPPPLEETTRV